MAEDSAAPEASGEEDAPAGPEDAAYMSASIDRRGNMSVELGGRGVASVSLGGHGNASVSLGRHGAISVSRGRHGAISATHSRDGAIPVVHGRGGSCSFFWNLDGGRAPDLPAAPGSPAQEQEPPERCPICLSPFRSQHVGRPLKCRHSFCACCITRWTRRSATCPVDRKRFRLLEVRRYPGGPVTDIVSVGGPFARRRQHYPAVRRVYQPS